MSSPKCSDEDFISLYQMHGATELAKILGSSVRSIQSRRARLEKRLGRPLFSSTSKGRLEIELYPKRILENIDNGVVIIGSDAHYWPGIISTAHRGLVKLTKELSPKLVVLNGDVADMAQASSHSRIRWSKSPSVKEELEAIEERTSEIIEACKSSLFYWLLGNHCSRFEHKLSGNVPQYEGVPGMRLADHFPLWKFGLSLWVNEDVVIKHRFKGGIHATHNNTLWSGKTMVTGHLHSLKVTPFSDYNGIRFGVDTGTLADPYGEHADYAEDNPLNHRSGFIVLTFKNGVLLWPEICSVVDEDHIQFRGEVIKV